MKFVVTDRVDELVMHLLASFFFSSRRRHTRWPRDWSSDVCSSDLTNTLGVKAVVPVSPTAFTPRVFVVDSVTVESVRNRGTRSEERRVGKECGGRWWRCAS